MAIAEVTRTTGVAALDKKFSLAMITGTLLPMAIFAVLPHPYHPGNPAMPNQLLWFVMLFARGHVGLTYLIYLDRSFAPVLRQHKLRLIVIPAMILTMLPLLLMTSDVLLHAAIYIVLAWNIWHFNKQNVGIYALISIAERRPSPTMTERRLINAAAFFGIAGTYPMLFPADFSDNFFHPWLVTGGNLALYPFAAIAASAVAYMLWHWQRYSLIKAVFYLMTIFAFGMVFVVRAIYPGNGFAFAMGQGVAHAIQYTIIVSLVTVAASGDGRLLVLRNIGETVPAGKAGIARLVGGTLITLTIFCWGLYQMKGGDALAALDQWFGTTVLLRWIVSFAVAGLVTHFVIDAGAFRLSEKPQREWLWRRLGIPKSPGGAGEDRSPAQHNHDLARTPARRDDLGAGNLDLRRYRDAGVAEAKTA
jgi:hypothetical protein